MYFDMFSDLICSLIAMILISGFIASILNFVDSIRQGMDKDYIFIQGIAGIITFTLINTIVSNFKSASIHHTPYYVRIPMSFILFFIVCLIYMNLHFYSMIKRYKQSHITPLIFKQSLDQLDAGLCYFTDDGNVLLINTKMNDIFSQIVGDNILDGNEIWRIIDENEYDQYEHDKYDNVKVIHFADDSFYKFSLNPLMIDGLNINEIIATDITREAKMNYELMQENYRQIQLNDRLRRYSYMVEKITNEEEILNAKVRIHNDLGKLLIVAKHLISSDASNDEKEELLTDIRNTLYLLSVNGEEKSNYSADFKEIQDVAKTIGVEIHFNNKIIIRDRKLYDVLLTAIHECLTNTVSHADGHNLYVDFDIMEDEYRLTLRNDGKAPEKPIVYGGGLTNLNNKVERVHGIMNINYDDGFTVVIHIPIEGIKYEI